MDPEKSFARLMKEARERGPDERVPYAFEMRVMRSVRKEARPDPTYLWAAGLWHAVVPCSLVAAVAITASITFFRVQDSDLSAGTSMSDQAEPVELLAPAALDGGDSSGEALW